jgi:formamidopyrimidine-DNA glycosylase
MTGQLLVDPNGESTHTRFLFQLCDAQDRPFTLEFRDIRKFGRLHLTAGHPAPRIEVLGPDAWRGSWGADYLGRRLKGRTAPLKAFLLDQRHLSGIGNIYADEILWWTGLSPLRACGSLSADEVSRLAEEIPRRLGEGVRLLGCSISDFVDTQGAPGTFQEWLQAYGRQGQECRRCGARLERAVVAGRGTAYCAGCQV